MQGTRALHSDEKARELKAEEGDDCTLVLQVCEASHMLRDGATSAVAMRNVQQCPVVNIMCKMTVGSVENSMC